MRTTEGGMGLDGDGGGTVAGRYPSNLRELTSSTFANGLGDPLPSGCHAQAMFRRDTYMLGTAGLRTAWMDTSTDSKTNAP